MDLQIDEPLSLSQDAETDTCHCDSMIASSNDCSALITFVRSSSSMSQSSCGRILL